MHQLRFTFLWLISGIRVVFAETSLYVPGFDPQPLSADVLGVDSNGRTTWALHKGVPTGTFDHADFVGTATLVLGSDFASLTYVDPAGAYTMGRDCSLSSGLAICTASSGTITEVATETATPIAVQAATATVSSVTTRTSSSKASAVASASAASATTASTTATSTTATSNDESLTPYLLGVTISIMMVGFLGSL